MKRKLLIAAAALLVLVLIGIAVYAFTHPRAPSNDFQIRSVVYGFGDEVGQVSLATTTEGVSAVLDRHYALYVHPDLLASWKAAPLTAPSRQTLGTWPDHIDIQTVTKNDNDTYTVDASVMPRERESVPATQGTLVRFTLGQGLDGWLITAYETGTAP